MARRILKNEKAYNSRGEFPDEKAKKKRSRKMETISELK